MNYYCKRQRLGKQVYFVVERSGGKEEQKRKTVREVREISQ